jgi:hypothetical protein
VAILLGCSDPYTTPALPDAGATDSSVTPPMKILYVSAALGRESHDGLTRERPLRSVAAALSVQATEKLNGYEIHVCAGEYAETNLQIRTPSVLRGGYNCTTWLRSDGFGLKGEFRDPNRTIIASKAEPAPSSVFNVDTAGDVTIEGFEIVAGAPGAAVAAKNSNLTLRDDRIRAATVPANAITPTAGVNASGGTVTFESCEAYGGAGRATAAGTAGSTGVSFAGATGSLRNSRVFGGTGVGEVDEARGAVGVWVDTTTLMAGDVRVEDNLIQGEGGRSLPATSALIFSKPYTGLIVANSVNAVVARNRIFGGRATAGRFATTSGVRIENSGTLLFAENRVDTGELDTSNISTCFSVLVLGAGITRAINNALSGGCASSISATVYPVGLYALGKVHVMHNTLVGVRGAEPGAGRALIVGADGDVEMENSLLYASDHGVEHSPCGSTPAKLRAFRNNVVAGVEPIRLVEGAACTARNNGTLADLGATPTVADNVLIAMPALVPATPAMMRAAILGRDSILPAPGQCAIARGGLNLQMLVSKDIAGAPRGVKPTIGAWESVDTRCP